MIDSIARLWHSITNLGVDEAALGREVVKVRILNQLMSVALTTSVVIIIVYIITNDTQLIILSTLGNISIEATGLCLAYYKKHKTARYFAFILFPTWVAVNVITNKGGFGEANLFLAFAFCSFIMFEGERKLQIPVVIYTSLLFIFSKLYVINYTSPDNLAVNPYDEIITFPFVLLILGIIILLYQREIKKFEAQRTHWIDDLEEKNVELSRINDELEQFTYIASHDLKTPLRTISSHLDLIQWHIKRGKLDLIDEDISFAKQGTKQMYALINDILEYKQISQKAEQVAVVDLNNIIEKVKAQLNSVIQEKNAQIEVTDLPKITGRWSDLLILFQNLIENGIKYNESEIPRVKISHQITEKYLVIRIEDNGIGIEEVYKEQIFQFFKRLHTSDKYEGTGIGLGLCKKIIESYHGNISIDTSFQNGAAFLLQFPLDMNVSSIE